MAGTPIPRTVGKTPTPARNCWGSRGRFSFCRPVQAEPSFRPSHSALQRLPSLTVPSHALLNTTQCTLSPKESWTQGCCASPGLTKSWGHKRNCQYSKVNGNKENCIRHPLVVPWDREFFPAGHALSPRLQLVTNVLPSSTLLRPFSSELESPASTLLNSAYFLT